MRSILILLLCTSVLIAKNSNHLKTAGAGQDLRGSSPENELIIDDTDYNPNNNSLDNSEKQKETGGNQRIGANESERMVKKTIMENNPEDLKNNKFLVNIETAFTLGIILFKRIWILLQSSDGFYPFQVGTKLYYFYVNFFPFVKLITAVTILVVFYNLIRNLFSVILKKGEKTKSADNGVVITLPNADVILLPGDPIQLKGRTRRIPDSLNYTQLFNNEKLDKPINSI